MALPLIIAGLALTSVAAHRNATKYYQKANELRFAPLIGVDNGIQNRISSYNPRLFTENVPAGSIVCCEVYGVFDHTAIWIENDIIIELSNSGLVRAVNYERFLQARSGNNIYICTDRSGGPIVLENVAETAIRNVYDFREYSLLKYNCHSFVQECLVSETRQERKPAVYFSDLNQLISESVGGDVYWDKLNV